MRIVKLTKETTENILENMLKRSPTQYERTRLPCRRSLRM